MVQKYLDSWEFSEDDDQIRFMRDSNNEAGIPQVRAATIEKLIERLTYPNFPGTLITV